MNTENPIEIFIPGNVPSYKNSKKIIPNKKSGFRKLLEENGQVKPLGRFKIVGSNASRTYIKNTELFYISHANKFRETVKDFEKPYHISLYFIRATRQRFDFINMAQIIFDLMVKHHWIEDDNANEILPVFDGYTVDKNNPGVIIKVIGKE